MKRILALLFFFIASPALAKYPIIPHGQHALDLSASGLETQGLYVPNATSANLFIDSGGNLDAAGNVQSTVGNWSIDFLGNITTNSSLGVGPGNSKFSVDSSGNLNAAGSLGSSGGKFSVDASGNLTSNGTASLGGGHAAFDASGNLTAAAGTFAGPLATPIKSVSANYTLLATDSVVYVNALSGAKTITIPEATTAPVGTQITIKKTDGTTNVVTVQTPGVTSIDGSTAQPLTGRNQSLVLVSDGGQWRVNATEGWSFTSAVGNAQQFSIDQNGNTSTSGTLSAGATTVSSLKDSGLSNANANSLLLADGTGNVTNAVNGNFGLFWDATNKRLAINKTSANATIDIYGQNADAGFIVDHGNAPVLMMGGTATAAIIGTNNWNNESLVIKSGMTYPTFTSGNNALEFDYLGNIKVGTGPNTIFNSVGDATQFKAGSSGQLSIDSSGNVSTSGTVSATGGILGHTSGSACSGCVGEVITFTPVTVTVSSANTWYANTTTPLGTLTAGTWLVLPHTQADTNTGAVVLGAAVSTSTTPGSGRITDCQFKSDSTQPLENTMTPGIYVATGPTTIYAHAYSYTNPVNNSVSGIAIRIY